ncbi:MAG TPA: SDR family oxidoreductase [Bryobacteraceae bacterium]|nr:SDR family oxidoreductase [Bryobacteraceae bacterium]
MLDGRVVLVTGAAKRIGRGIALRLVREGARVAIHYGNSEIEARRTAEECGDAPLYRANLERVSEIQKLFDNVEHTFGRLDGLVNNAARFTTFDPLDITEADWDYIHNVNLKGAFFCCQQGAKLMRKSGGGRIVNISSLGGLRPWAHNAHYCASKAGLIMLTQALAKAFAPDITVNSVAPGVIAFGPLTDLSERLVSITPAHRPGTADEIADAVVYFLQASNFVTGQIMAVDGGLGLK